jgi:hypothetical protein
MMRMRFMGREIVRPVCGIYMDWIDWLSDIALFWTRPYFEV